MNCYFVGMMFGRSCTVFSYFVLIIQLILPPYGQFLFVIGQLKNYLVKLIEALMEISILSFLLSLAFKEIFITFKKKLKERFIIEWGIW